MEMSGGSVVPDAQFASDNASAICPEAWSALQEANDGYVEPYGDDSWTKRAVRQIRELLDADCSVHFCMSGTAANALAISQLCRSHHAVICHDLAHVETDECGAPEFFTGGAKLLRVRGPGGKVAVDAVERVIEARADVHFPRPRVLSVTQSTEVGTTYRVAELATLAELAHENGLLVHMDGARLANAVAQLGVSARKTTKEVGVDVLCLGGTKSGLGVGEAVVFFDPELAAEFDFRTKQAGQLASKMRFLSAPWAGILESGAWLRNAEHANACADRLATELQTIPGVRLLAPREANAVFVNMPTELVRGLRERGWSFYEFPGVGGHRFMCSWQTRDAEIRALVGDLRALSS